MLTDTEVNKSTISGLYETCPAFAEWTHAIINKLSAARNYVELMENAETEHQAAGYRARALQGIDEAVGIIRESKK